MAKVNFQEMSDQKCSCGNYIKQNLVNRKSSRPVICFACFQAKSMDSEAPVRTARDIRRHPELRSQKRWKKGIPLRSFG